MALLLLNHVIHPFRHSNPQRQETDPFRATTRSCTGHNISPIILRRSANYHPNIWDYESLQSLSSEYTADRYFRRTRELKNNVRNLFNAEDKGTMQLLELVDTLQRLGIAYLFENEIKACLDTVAAKNKISITGGDLHATALYFRLLRQHGHQISQDIFIGFKDGSSNFCVSLSDDIKGLLSLYEASHLAVPGEMILSEAKAFAKSHLQNLISPIAPDYAKQISHSLELPLHWRVLRLEARWYIEEIMTGNHDTCPDQLELATLDFNIVQATHQNDLKEMARWWMDLGLGSHNQLSFTRDRLMENFLWTIGVNFYPQYSYCRRSLTKLNTLITTIDDVYDVYGSLEELELFTDAVERWDVNNIAQLPYYMKICFLALYNTVNEFAYVTLKEQGFDVTYYLKKPWADLCKSYLVEAKWYYNKYTPKLEEYLSNAWISISGPVILVHAYFLLKQEINRDILSSLEEYSPNIIRWSAIILRLSNDLTTSTAETERGDVPKSIQCYMHETRCSEETAREHIRRLIDETWMKMNKDRATASIVSETFLETAVNLARMAQCMYQHGDGHGVSDQETKAKAIALLVEPITPKHDLQD